MLFVMFESFGELITLERGDERGNILYRVHLRLEKGRENKRPIAKCLLFFLCCTARKKKSHNHASHNAQNHAVFLRLGLLPSAPT